MIGPNAMPMSSKIGSRGITESRPPNARKKIIRNSVMTMSTYRAVFRYPIKTRFDLKFDTFLMRD